MIRTTSAARYFQSRDPQSHTFVASIVQGGVSTVPEMQTVPMDQIISLRETLDADHLDHLRAGRIGGEMPLVAHINDSLFLLRGAETLAVAKENGHREALVLLADYGDGHRLGVRLPEMGDVYGHPIDGPYGLGHPYNEPQYRERSERVRAANDDYIAKGLSTDQIHDHITDPESGKDVLYSPSREELHKDILARIQYDIAATVPRKHRAVVLAGPSGAGKTSFLKSQEGRNLLGVHLDGRDNPTNYFVINPDEMKEHLLDHVDMSKYPKLQRNEMASIVHEESSHLAEEMTRDTMGASGGFDVLIDVTLANEEKTFQKYMDPYPGYTFTAVLIDGEIATSFHNAGNRYKFADPRNDTERNFGGRWLDPKIIEDQRPTPGSGMRSKNAEQFLQFIQRERIKAAYIFDLHTRITRDARTGEEIKV